MPRKPSTPPPTPEPEAPAPKKRGRRYATFKEKATADRRAARAAKEETKRTERAAATPSGDIVDIWERRITNPHHQESVPVRIKTPGMKLRWINLANRNRFYRARFEQGWVPVHRSELIEEREVFGATFTADGSVCRGERQSEMLMKMPQSVFDKIQRAKGQKISESYKKLKEQLGKAGGEHFRKQYNDDAIIGEQAEEAASQFKGDIRGGRERVTTDELFE